MTIKDKLIEPYQIEFDGTQYTVGIPKTDKKGVEMLHNAHYFSSLPNALKRIVALKIGSEGNYVKNLKEYINDYNEMFLKFTNSIKI